MAQYKDEERGTWYCKFYYQDWTGERKAKMKRGFVTKREAAAWEREFLERLAGSPSMPFKSFVTLYLEDAALRLRPSTMYAKELIYRKWITPYFKDLPINEIGPAQIRKWQSALMEAESAKGQPLTPTYLRSLNKELNVLFNYAVRYYNLPFNPAQKAGTMGKAKGTPMQFWTHEQYKLFAEAIKDYYCALAFETLFYTGLRCGELLALTLSDIDLKARTINVSKTYHGKDIITPPKTENSNRTVTIPQFLCNNIQEHIGRMYRPEPDDRIFCYTNQVLYHAMKKGSVAAGVPRIRIHDIRHSHVSMLIDLGFTPQLVAERIGDTVEMVYSTYGHLYPNRHIEVADKLQEIVSN